MLLLLFGGRRSLSGRLRVGVQTANHERKKAMADENAEKSADSSRTAAKENLEGLGMIELEQAKLELIGDQHHRIGEER